MPRARSKTLKQVKGLLRDFVQSNTDEISLDFLEEVKREVKLLSRKIKLTKPRLAKQPKSASSDEVPVTRINSNVPSTSDETSSLDNDLETDRQSDARAPQVVTTLTSPASMEALEDTSLTPRDGFQSPMSVVESTRRRSPISSNAVPEVTDSDADNASKNMDKEVEQLNMPPSPNQGTGLLSPESVVQMIEETPFNDGRPSLEVALAPRTQSPMSGTLEVKVQRPDRKMNTLKEEIDTADRDKRDLLDKIEAYQVVYHDRSSEIERFGPEKWFNASQIMDLLLSFEWPKNFLVVDSSFVEEDMARKKWSLQDHHDRIILPCCLRQHWTLFDADMLSYEIRHYDSSPEHTSWSDKERIKNLIKSQILAHERKEFNIEGVDQWMNDGMELKEAPCREQRNDFDCGLFVIANAESLISKREVEGLRMESNKARSHYLERFVELERQRQQIPSFSGQHSFEPALQEVPRWPGSFRDIPLDQRKRRSSDSEFGQSQLRILEDGNLHPSSEALPVSETSTDIIGQRKRRSSDSCLEGQPYQKVPCLSDCSNDDAPEHRRWTPPIHLGPKKLWESEHKTLSHALKALGKNERARVTSQTKAEELLYLIEAIGSKGIIDCWGPAASCEPEGRNQVITVDSVATDICRLVERTELRSFKDKAILRVGKWLFSYQIRQAVDALRRKGTPSRQNSRSIDEGGHAVSRALQEFMKKVGRQPGIDTTAYRKYRRWNSDATIWVKMCDVFGPTILLLIPDGYYGRFGALITDRRYVDIKSKERDLFIRALQNLRPDLHQILPRFEDRLRSLEDDIPKLLAHFQLPIRFDNRGVERPSDKSSTH